MTEPLSDPYLGMLVLVSAATAVGGAQWRAVRREGSWAADTLFRLGTTGVCVAALGVWSALIAVQFSEFAGLVETMVIGSGAWLLLVGAALMFGSATAAAHLRRRTVFVVTLWPASGRRRVEKFLGPVDN
ncbi:hypothetical protein [Pseudonocardia oroxyli]|uniref:hypothetical protein n=1 Tax=Pseudonocardia oroxyli TaxID=366584 RepID=UPI00115FB55B|nr:hypothetical protein [Pseudonocardia oroxyli]